MKAVAATLMLLLTAAARADAPVPDVRMDEFIVARVAEHPVVRTWGVSTCVVLTLYDASNGVGALAHISAEADIPRSLDAVFGDLRRSGAALSDLQAQLFGGWRTQRGGVFAFHSTSPEMVAQIKGWLTRRDIPITREETLVDPAQPGPFKPIHSFSFDLRDGVVSDISPGPGLAPSRGDDPAEDARFARTGLLQRSPFSFGAASATPRP